MRKSANTEQDTLEDINQLRITLGMAPIIFRERDCISCGHKFSSAGLHNRICTTCKNRKVGAL